MEAGGRCSDAVARKQSYIDECRNGLIYKEARACRTSTNTKPGKRVTMTASMGAGQWRRHRSEKEMSDHLRQRSRISSASRQVTGTRHTQPRNRGCGAGGNIGILDEQPAAISRSPAETAWVLNPPARRHDSGRPQRIPAALCPMASGEWRTEGASW